MSDLPSIASRLQVEESQFRDPVSESMIQKFGQTANFLLDHYPIPPGAVIPYAGLLSSIPHGMLVCDGLAYSRTTYANLFTAIGTNWGVGDNLTTFNVPDLRGYFLRGISTTARGASGNDPDMATRTPLGTGAPGDPGSIQNSVFAAHDHGWSGQGGAGGITSQFFTANVFTSYGLRTEVIGGNETRPKNAYVIFIIQT